MSIYSGVAPFPSLLWQPATDDWRGRGTCGRMVAEAYPEDREYVANRWWPVGVYRSDGRGHPRHLTPEAAEAVELCKKCPVQSECAEAGLDEADGVWGGLLPHERESIRRRQQRQEQRRKVSA